ncbi:uncharacterized protein DNG_07482 [Cephalotrichum gorgonifer]|uniref:Uncharacterized protein n=1 Tax=Cephalotrichum gorgonifer TaxID=2041049 RepID=A0AAE8N4Q7_9PEZI|nr:uncharacterized protein DNG_07482 [Cephalotrichum gorgonifer]
MPVPLTPGPGHLPSPTAANAPEGVVIQGITRVDGSTTQLMNSMASTSGDENQEGEDVALYAYRELVEFEVQAARRLKQLDEERERQSAAIQEERAVLLRRMESMKPCPIVPSKRPLQGESGDERAQKARRTADAEQMAAPVRGLLTTPVEDMPPKALDVGSRDGKCPFGVWRVHARISSRVTDVTFRVERLNSSDIAPRGYRHLSHLGNSATINTCKSGHVVPFDLGCDLIRLIHEDPGVYTEEAEPPSINGGYGLDVKTEFN